jgi:hypothetical protein
MLKRAERYGPSFTWDSKAGKRPWEEAIDER